MAGGAGKGASSDAGQVSVPEVKVKLGGRDVAEELGCGIQKVSVKLSGNDASQALVELWDCYDIKSHSLASGLKSSLELGAKVEVGMGYQSSLTTVFCGYLEAVSLDMTEQDAYILCIKAFDVIKLLKENVRCHIWKGTSHSSVVSEILDDYSWICGKEVDSTPKLDKEEDWWQTESDFDFIVNEMSGIYNPKHKFYVSDGTAYFKIPKKESEAADLEPEDGITDFHASWHYLNKNIKVQGISADHEAYLGEAEAVGLHVGSSAGQGSVFRVLPQAGTQDGADAVAGSMAGEEKEHAVDISLTVPGLPRLKPGKYLKLSGMDGWVNGTYLIEEAEHVMDQEGYRTSVKLGGC